jgi:hypothetical protein
VCFITGNPFLSSRYDAHVAYATSEGTNVSGYELVYPVLIYSSEQLTPSSKSLIITMEQTFDKEKMDDKTSFLPLRFIAKGGFDRTSKKKEKVETIHVKY